MATDRQPALHHAWKNTTLIKALKHFLEKSIKVCLFWQHAWIWSILRVVSQRQREILIICLYIFYHHTFCWVQKLDNHLPSFAFPLQTLFMGSLPDGYMTLMKGTPVCKHTVCLKHMQLSIFFKKFWNYLRKNRTWHVSHSFYYCTINYNQSSASTLACWLKSFFHVNISIFCRHIQHLFTSPAYISTYIPRTFLTKQHLAASVYTQWV